ncbi:MAG TPA: PQQ-binding-like beta-propeller repeat protein, partial [Pyrinomonadaceae bacterium]|nr:PQQ-binding-like beta-propeller repeat protein [Pyrinomonadaceae bacterium]
MKSLFVLALYLAMASVAYAQNWPSFRGQNSAGVGDGSTPPTSWDAEKSINILWKTPIPGLAHSSPIIWKDRIFVTTAVSSAANSQFVHGITETPASAEDNSKHSWRVYSLDKNSGRIIWEKAVYEGVPKVKRHVKASYANPTPSTDGKHLVISFGSEGLYCFDLDGKLLWKKDLGILDGGWSSDAGFHWGFGSSPVIYKHLAIVQCDTQNQSFIAAFNLADGKRVWQTTREEDSSWSTPTIYEAKDRAELITSGTKYYRGYDPLTGKELWRIADGVDVKIPTPIAANDLYLLGGGGSNARRTFYAVRAGVKGEIKPAEADTKSIAWQSVQIKPHIVTPIVYGEFLYVCTDNGILSQYKVTTGEPGFRARLGSGGSFSASPVAADGKLYFASEDGDVFVVKAGPTFELLARNPMGEVMMATPAIG